MATYRSIGTGNFTTAGTWSKADSVGVSLAGSTSTAITTSYLYSTAAALTSGIVIDAVALQIGAIGGTTGTLDIVLRNTTDSTDSLTLTVNVSDFHSAGNGIYIAKFGSTYTTVAGKSYAIGLRRSVGASTLSGLCASGNNWNTAFFINGASANAPNTNADIFIVAGELTGAGTQNSYTVTVDVNVTTQFVPHFCAYSTATHVTGTGSGYNLSSDANIWGGATYNIGTNGAPITNRALIQSSISGPAVIYARAGSTWNVYGSAMSYWYTRLNGDVAASAGSVVTVDSTGWDSPGGMTFAIAGTTRAARQTESVTVSSISGGTTITLVSPTGSAHTGTNTSGQDQRAHCVVLHRANVQILGSSATFKIALNIENTATVTMRWASIGANNSGPVNWFGSATAGKRGIDIATTTGTCDIQYCLVGCNTSTASAIAFNVTSASGSGITISNNAVVKLSGSSAQGFVNVATSGTQTVSENIFMNIASTGFNIGDAGSTYTNNVCVDSGLHGFSLTEASALGTFSGQTAYACASNGIYHNATIYTLDGNNGTFLSCTVWRCNGSGIITSSITRGLVFDTCRVWGCTTAGFNLATGNVRLTGCYADAGAGETQPTGLTFFQGVLYLTDCYFGSVQTHATTDLTIRNQGENYIIGNNVTLASTTQFNVTGYLLGDGCVAIQNLGQVANSTKVWTRHGTQVRNTANVDTGYTECIELVPSIAANNNGAKLYAVGSQGTPIYVPVTSGTGGTLTVRMKKSAGYNGNNPGITVKFLGATINARAAQAVTTSYADYTVAVANGSITQTGAIQVDVDCDGTAGSLYIQKISLA